MTKLIWKRTSNGNPMLSFWQLKAVVFQQRSGSWSYNILGLDRGVAWGRKFATEADARAGAEAAFLEAKAPHDWQTPGRRAWEARIDAGLSEAPMQVLYKSNYARLDAHADHETAKAMHFDGCPNKGSSCRSDRCGECWSRGFWVPKSKLYFDRNEQQWYINRSWAEQHDIHVAEDDYADALEHGGDR